MKVALAVLLSAAGCLAQMRMMALPAKSPLVTFRIVFLAGSEADPADKPGVAYLTAMMLGNGGTKEMTYKQITDALFPMAASVNVQVDKEMVTFSGSTHVDNLNEYYKVMRAMLLDPGWREDDFARVKSDAVNYVKVGLRGNNDEELGKEVLYENIYAGTPYGHLSAGWISSLESITLDDLKRFYRTQYNQTNLILGIAGGYPASFTDSMRKDFRSLPQGPGFRPREKSPDIIQHTRAVIVDKDTRSVAMSIGFPISVTRRSPDYAAMLVAATYFGQHRMSGGVLYEEMREKRGLNYGDYAYIEYFPRGMYLMEPPPNVARRFQIFQIWIRPVEPPTAQFALRLAMYELDKLIKQGLSQEAFERTRDFLMRYVNILTRTRRAELGYSIDSMFYDRPKYTELVQQQLARLTREDVNRAIKAHLRTEKLVIVAVAKNAEELKQQLLSPDASPMTYNSPKPKEITDEDKVVEKWPLNLRPEDIKVLPADSVFK